MDIVEAIQQRKSIRAFKPDPVPKEILKEILDLALRAPSWANTQPDKEKRRWWLLQGLKLFGAPCVIYIVIDCSFHIQGNGLNIWPIFDCGLVAENIMLLATKYGLGTIAQIQAVVYPDVLRKVLEIPDSKLIVLGIAVGYPDRDDPVNQLRSEREPLDNVSTWHGFD